MKEYELAASYLVQATRTGLSGNWQHYLHFYLGIAYAHLERYEESKREFLACEDQTAERPFSLIDIYKWLSYVCRRLGDTSESKKYAALQRTM
jgi:hypothetical protein